MLKYIGDFDKLKDYGFEVAEKEYAPKWELEVIGYYKEIADIKHFGYVVIFVDIKTRILDTRYLFTEYDEDEDMRIEQCKHLAPHDLIKDGLVIKE